MDRKIVLTIIFLFAISASWADSRQSLHLRAVVPVRVKIETNQSPNGHIEPVIKSNVSKNTHQVKVRASRTPASVKENYQVVIEAN